MVVKKKKEGKRHHYVPQCYLKNFTFDESKKLLYAYSRRGEIIKTNIRDIAVKKHLYTFIEKRTKRKTNIIEKFFSEIERMACPILKRIVNKKNIKVNKKEKGILSLFVSLLATRTPAFDSWQRGIEMEVTKKVMQKIAENPTALKSHFKKAGIKVKNDKEFEEMRELILEMDNHFQTELKGGKSYFFKRSMKLAFQPLASIFFYKKWHLLVNQTSRVFVTSDNPVAIQKSKGVPWQFNSGFAGGVIILSLSPHLCLLLRNTSLKEEIINVNRSQVERINHSIMLFSQNFIYTNLESKDIKQTYSNISKDNFQKPVIKTFGPYVVITSHSLDEEVVI